MTLNNINITFEKENGMQWSGGSGSGKSTLTKLHWGITITIRDRYDLMIWICMHIRKVCDGAGSSHSSKCGEYLKILCEIISHCLIRIQRKR